MKNKNDLKKQAYKNYKYLTSILAIFGTVILNQLT